MTVSRRDDADITSASVHSLHACTAMHRPRRSLPSGNWSTVINSAAATSPSPRTASTIPDWPDHSPPTPFPASWRRLIFSISTSCTEDDRFLIASKHTRLLWFWFFFGELKTYRTWYDSRNRIIGYDAFMWIHWAAPSKNLVPSTVSLLMGQMGNDMMTVELWYTLGYISFAPKVPSIGKPTLAWVRLQE